MNSWMDLNNTLKNQLWDVHLQLIIFKVNLNHDGHYRYVTLENTHTKQYICKFYKYYINSCGSSSSWE